MGIYLSSPKTEKLSEDGESKRLRYGLSSMQGWRATMEDAHAAITDLDANTSFFGVYDGHGGKVVAKFCAKYLHQQVCKHEAYAAGDIGTSVQKAFFRKFLEDLEVIDVVTSPRGHFGDVERCLLDGFGQSPCNADCTAYTYLLDGFGQSPL